MLNLKKLIVLIILFACSNSFPGNYQSRSQLPSENCKRYMTGGSITHDVVLNDGMQVKITKGPGGKCSGMRKLRGGEWEKALDSKEEDWYQMFDQLEADYTRKKK